MNPFLSQNHRTPTYLVNHFNFAWREKIYEASIKQRPPIKTQLLEDL